jgi:PAS domain S-box-containing protein
MTVSKEAGDGSRAWEREDDYRTMFELAGIGAAQVEPTTGRFLRVNPKFCEITGYSEEELLSTTFQGITYPDDRTEDFEGFRQMVRGEIPHYEVEKRYVRKDGEVVWVSVNTTMIRDEAGRPLRTVAVIQDVTERKQGEEELRRSEERFRGLAEGVNFIPWEADPNTWRFTYVGPQAVEILGHPLEDWYEGDFWAEHIHPEDREWTVNFCAEASVSCQRYRFEYRMLAADGRTVWLDDIVHVAEAQDGLQQLRGVMIDITERKRAEEEIETRTHQQAAVAELGLRALAKEDLQAVVDEAVALVAKTLGAEYCKVLELLPGGDELLLRAGVGWREGLVGNATVGAGLDSQAGYTLFSSEPVIVEDLPTEGRFSGPPLLNEHGVVSGASVVVQGRDGPFGVLGVHTTAHRIFSKDDVNFLQAAANVLAMAIERKEAEKKLNEVRDAERNRLARDLHDGALQDLAYAQAEVKLVQAISEDPELGDRLQRALGALKRTGQELRGAVYELALQEEKDRPFLELLGSLVELNRQMVPDRDLRLQVREGFRPVPSGSGIRSCCASCGRR